MPLSVREPTSTPLGFIRRHWRLWLDGGVTTRHPLINTSHPVAQMIKRALFVGLRHPAAGRDRDEPGRLLPPPRQEAEAVPDADGPGDAGRQRHRDDVQLRPGPVRRHARRHRGGAEAGPARDLHLEGRRDRPALQEGGHRRGRPGCGGPGHLRLVRQPRGAAAVQALPGRREGARLSRSTRPAGGSSTCVATAATTARSSSSTTRSASSAATTSGRPTPRSGATRTAGSPGRASGTSARAFADFWNLHRDQEVRPQRSRRC